MLEKNDNINEKPEVQEQWLHHAEEVKLHHAASKREYTPGSPEEQRYLDWEASFKRKERVQNQIKRQGQSASSETQESTKNEVPFAEPLEHVQGLISIIDSVRLEDPNDTEMQKVLAANKEMAKNLIAGVMGKARGYASMVYAFNKARVDVKQGEISTEEFVGFDQNRKRKHDALISSINMTNRYITQKFGIISEDELDDYLEQEEQAGRPVAETIRVHLPKNVICPNYVDLSNREDITHWALDVLRSTVQ